MITFNVIVERFRQFADAHFFIRSFSHGTPADVDLDKFTEFPLMHLVYTGSRYGDGSKFYSMEVFVMGMGPTTEGKFDVARNVVSDSEQCLEDVLADLRAGWNIFDFEVNLSNASVSPLFHEDHNTLVGAALLIELEVPYDHSACFAPLDDVTPGSKTTQFARRGVLLIKEEDGSPEVASVRTIIVPNDSLTDLGDGEVQLSFLSGEFAKKDKVITFGDYIAYQGTVGFGAIDGAIWNTSSSWRIRYDFDQVTVTGDAVVGFTYDIPLGRFINLTGMSTGMTVDLKFDMEVYQDTSVTILPEVGSVTVYSSLSGAVEFADTFFAVNENLPIPIPTLESQAVTITFSKTILIVTTHPDASVTLYLNSLYGSVRFKVTNWVLTVFQ